MERGWFMTEDSVLNSAPASDMVAVYATAKDIASAMAYVHSKGIIHGDLRGDSLGLASSDQDPRGFTAKVMRKVFLCSSLLLYALSRVMKDLFEAL